MLYNTRFWGLCMKCVDPVYRRPALNASIKTRRCRNELLWNAPRRNVDGIRSRAD